MTEKQFEEFIAFCVKCGTRLKEINDRLRKENENWKGEIEIRI